MIQLLSNISERTLSMIYNLIKLQKIVNGIAIASGVVSLTVVGLGGYVFIRKDAIIENVKCQVLESVLPGGVSGLLGEGAGTGAIGGGALGGIGESLPASPDAPSAPVELPSF